MDICANGQVVISQPVSMDAVSALLSLRCELTGIHNSNIRLGGKGDKRPGKVCYYDDISHHGSPYYRVTEYYLSDRQKDAMKTIDHLIELVKQEEENPSPEVTSKVISEYES